MKGTISAARRSAAKKHAKKRHYCGCGWSGLGNGAYRHLRNCPKSVCSW